MKLLFVTMLLLAAGAAPAGVVEITLPPETASFKPGAGVQFANGQCLVCHSVDYVVIQPPLPRAFWEGEVKKMQQTYGAPIPQEQVEPIVDYLARTYGTDTNAAPPTSTSVAANTNSPSTPNLVSPGETLANKYGCLLCHGVDKKIVGPAYKDIAKKYSQDPNALARITEQVHQGGSGKWGSAIMPPFPMVSNAEIQALATWILSR